MDVSPWGTLVLALNVRNFNQPHPGIVRVPATMWASSLHASGLACFRLKKDQVLVCTCKRTRKWLILPKRRPPTSPLCNENANNLEMRPLTINTSIHCSRQHTHTLDTASLRRPDGLMSDGRRADRVSGATRHSGRPQCAPLPSCPARAPPAADRS